MNVDNLVQLTRGELRSNPSISAIENFTYDANAIRQGDVYVAVDKSQSGVDLAVKNGAYAVLYDKELKISDDEIAWIQVESIEMAIMRLMRFQSSYKKLHFVALSYIQEELLASFRKLNNSYILPSNPLEAFLTIMKAGDESFIFCSNLSILQKVAPVHESVWTETKVQNLSQGSLFISSFVHEGELYQSIPISPLFLPAVCGVLSFLKSKKISFSLENIKSVEHFEPLFIDKFFCPKSFGQTRRALVIESDEELFIYEVKMLLKFLPVKDFIICKPKKVKLDIDVTYNYTDESYLKMLNDYKFRYALVLGDRYKIEQALIEKDKKRYPSLF